MTMLGEQTRCPDEAQVERLLFAHDGAAEDRTAFLAHLEHCAECRLLAGVLADEAGPGNRRSANTAGPRAARTFSDGEILDDRYEILAFVARGGMGEVYRAHDRLLGETVALKTVLCDSSAEAEALARFRAEVQLARRITHPNVCRILEFGLHERPPFGTTPFFTMPFLDGETLGRHLARRGRLPAAEVGPLVEQIAAGLDAIHREGVIHRDLKSENVFLLAEAGATPRVILMDFGLARTVLPSVSQIFSTGAGLAGTPAYVAPELLLGRRATPRADIYSLGVLVFEMLTGRIPFDGATAVQAAARRLYSVPPRLREIVASLDGRWEAFVARCLEREEDRRFANVASLLAALPPQSSPAPRRARLAVGAVVAATFAGVLIGMTGSSLPRHRTDPQPVPAIAAHPVEPPQPLSPPAAVEPSDPPPEKKKKRTAAHTRARPSNPEPERVGEAATSAENRPNLDALVNPYE